VFCPGHAINLSLFAAFSQTARGCRRSRQNANSFCANPKIARLDPASAPVELHGNFSYHVFASTVVSKAFSVSGINEEETDMLSSRAVRLVVLGFTQAVWAQSQDPAAGRVAPRTDYWLLVRILVFNIHRSWRDCSGFPLGAHSLMSITNAISALAAVGPIIVTGSQYPAGIRILGAFALFASMTGIVSGFLITDRILKMFRQSNICARF
jgi:hypothetical protein